MLKSLTESERGLYPHNTPPGVWIMLKSLTESKRGLYPHNTPPGVWIMLKSSTESERGLFPLWIILSVGFETDID